MFEFIQISDDEYQLLNSSNRDILGRVYFSWLFHCYCNEISGEELEPNNSFQSLINAKIDLIDRYIEKQNKQIEKLNELKFSINKN